jgi:putative transposase
VSFSWRERCDLLQLAQTLWGMGRSQLQEFKTMEKENSRLKKIVAELELDKLILKESLDFLKPKV